MHWRFVHAADVHLDSPLRGLERYDGAPVDAVRGATRRALVQLVDLAIQDQAAFLILAGDVYDGDWKDYNTGLYFAQQMARQKKEERDDTEPEAARQDFVVVEQREIVDAENHDEAESERGGKRQRKSERRLLEMWKKGLPVSLQSFAQHDL